MPHRRGCSRKGPEGHIEEHLEYMIDLLRDGEIDAEQFTEDLLKNGYTLPEIGELLDEEGLGGS